MPAPTRVPASAWIAELTAARDRGLTYLGHLAAVDRVDTIEVVVHLSTPDAAEQVLLCTEVPAADPVLPSAVPILPGADWHEREAAEMLGLRFAGHPDPRPLLLREPSGDPPLRRGTPLPARVQTPWPGASEPEPRPGAAGRRAGRRPRPPGVPDAWLAGQDPAGGGR